MMQIFSFIFNSKNKTRDKNEVIIEKESKNNNLFTFFFFIMNIKMLNFHKNNICWLYKRFDIQCMAYNIQKAWHTMYESV